MKEYQTDRLRNVGLFSHGGAGKTSLGEAMLFNSGATNRIGNVADGTTVSDYEPEEARRQISVQLSVLPIEWDEHKINVIDTPGYADFVGEVRETLRVIDAAIVLVDAVSGVEVGTELVWQQIAALGLPRLVFVNRIDRENADFLRVADQLNERFGNVVAIQVPIGSQDAFDGVVDLVRMRAFTGPDLTEGDVPSAVQDIAATLRERLLESVCETDDDLIVKYLEGEELNEDEVRSALQRAVKAGKITPALVGSATMNRGVRQLMQAIVEYLPSPADRGATTGTNIQTDREESLEVSPEAPLAAVVFKTAADQFVGRLTYLRIYSGVMRSDSHAFNSVRGRDERVGQLFVVRGKTQLPVTMLAAGDIGAVAKLQDTGTGDTLCQRDHALRLAPISFPEPVFTVSVQPKTKADLDKLGAALARLAEEDPTIHVQKDAATGEQTMSGMGESHLEIAAERIKRKFGVDILLGEPKVPYRETIQMPTRAEYKHKKQTGGHGQYGHVFLDVEPQPRGAGFEFTEKVVGGAVPRNYYPAVEKGVREALSEGILVGYPVVDVKVTLSDGSYHPVDSSEMAFKIASQQAFRKGLEQGKPILLEPVVEVAITVPEQYVGDVMSDLNTRRARVQGLEPQDGSTVIRAQAPLAEMQRYATDLRSVTQGRGYYTMSLSHYEEVPAHITQSIVEATKREHAAAHS
ncbi:MAG TPA: elongation factor G [Chloroflexota bacterium]|nr:elongation factor G [Chloroflexota bacterium]